MPLQPPTVLDFSATCPLAQAHEQSYTADSGWILLAELALNKDVKWAKSISTAFHLCLSVPSSPSLLTCVRTHSSISCQEGLKVVSFQGTLQSYSNRGSLKNKDILRSKWINFKGTISGTSKGNGGFLMSYWLVFCWLLGRGQQNR